MCFYSITADMRFYCVYPVVLSCGKANGALFCERPSNVLQNTVFYRLKGHVLQCV